jgi:hypothetical protein
MAGRRVVVTVEAQVRPSESQGKVELALRNVLGPVQPSIIKREGSVSMRAEGEEALAKLYQQVRSRQVMAAARRLLMQNSSGNRTWVYLNKQAAYVGVIAFCEEPGESPLGPILLTLEATDLPSLLDWLVPEGE